MFEDAAQAAYEAALASPLQMVLVGTGTLFAYIIKA